MPNFITTERLRDLDFRDTVLYLHPEADMTGEPSAWIGGTRRTDSGRVAAVTIGGVEFTGSELRTLFSLRSTDFDLSREDGGFVFTVRGYGHGVGMSQYGANTLAKEGCSAEEIVQHYFSGAVVGYYDAA